MLSLKSNEQSYETIRGDLMYDIMKIEYVRIYPLRAKLDSAWDAFQEAKESDDPEKIEEARLAFAEASFKFREEIDKTPLSLIFDHNYSIH